MARFILARTITSAMRGSLAIENANLAIGLVAKACTLLDTFRPVVANI